MTTQEKCVEEKKETNSMQEERDVSSRHMTWWRDAWWVRMDKGPHLRTARDRRKVWRAATRAARETRETERVARGEGETGARENGEKSKQHFARCLPLSHCNHCNNRSSRSSNCSDSALAVTLETKFIAKPVVELLAMVDQDLSSSAILTSLMIFSSLRRSSAHLRRVWWCHGTWVLSLSTLTGTGS